MGRGKAYVSLSFFKERKIDYSFEPFEQIIVFPCLRCESQAEMDAITTSWRCSICQEKGTLIHLIQANKDIKAKIYKPNKEKALIQRGFKKIIEGTEDSRQQDSIYKLQERINRLLIYYEVNTKNTQNTGF
jgi:hypothetical protein